MFDQVDSCRVHDDERDSEPEETDGVTKKPHPLEKLKEKLDEYLHELPVIGFNSGSYDINVAKKYVFPYLVKHEEVRFVIKRNNNHMCLKTEHLKFLDITNFLAPGFSYDAFIKAYECSQTKGYFPYEWVDSVDKLNYDQLPPCEAFYSSLSDSGITKEQYRSASVCAWDEHGMTSFRDFLVWYHFVSFCTILGSHR